MTDTSVRGSVVDELRGQPIPWWSVLITGALGVAFGAAVLIWPDISLRVMAALAGVWLFIAGLARIIGAFLPGTGSSVLHRVFSAVVGVIVLIAGLICLRNLVTRLALLSLLFAITWILTGITAVVVGVQREGAARAVWIVVGALSLLAGLIFVFAPGLSLTTLVLLTGVSSLVIGAAEVILAFRLRKA